MLQSLKYFFLVCCHLHNLYACTSVFSTFNLSDLWKCFICWVHFYQIRIIIFGKQTGPERLNFGDISVCMVKPQTQNQDRFYKIIQKWTLYPQGKVLTKDELHRSNIIYLSKLCYRLIPKWGICSEIDTWLSQLIFQPKKHLKSQILDFTRRNKF